MMDEDNEDDLSGLADLFDEKARWSEKTFGPGDRYAGVIQHIRKELLEIAAKPDDLVEWVDVMLLAMDGAWRSAKADGRAFVAALLAKHRVNVARQWPDWRTLAPDRVAEHVRDGEAAVARLREGTERRRDLGEKLSALVSEPDGVVYLLWQNDMVLGVFEDMDLAQRAATKVRDDNPCERGHWHALQASEHGQRWFQTEGRIARLKIERRDVTRAR